MFELLRASQDQGVFPHSLFFFNSSLGCRRVLGGVSRSCPITHVNFCAMRLSLYLFLANGTACWCVAAVLCCVVMSTHWRNLAAFDMYSPFSSFSQSLVVGAAFLSSENKNFLSDPSHFRTGDYVTPERLNFWEHRNEEWMRPNSSLLSSRRPSLSLLRQRLHARYLMENDMCMVKNDRKEAGGGEISINNNKHCSTNCTLFFLLFLVSPPF